MSHSGQGIFPLGNAYFKVLYSSLRTFKTTRYFQNLLFITDFGFGNIKLPWDQMFHRWEHAQNVGPNPFRFIFCHFGFLSLPYCVVSGNASGCFTFIHLSHCFICAITIPSSQQSTIKSLKFCLFKYNGNGNGILWLTAYVVVWQACV